MVGITWNKKKYIMLHNDNGLKTKSLADNIYFTLKDIFLNISLEFKMYEANELNGQLTNNIKYEERGLNFKYVELDGDFIKNILDFLNSIEPNDFEINYESVEDELDETTILSEYINFDIWWKQLDELKQILSNIKIKID